MIGSKALIVAQTVALILLALVLGPVIAVLGVLAAAAEEWMALSGGAVEAQPTTNQRK